MVNRNTLECDACGSRIVTRTQIGHGDSQVHAFPCPGCGIGITFIMNLDQQAITFQYDPHPLNAHWVEGEHGAKHTRVFITELLVPRNALAVNIGVSPFMMAYPLFADWEAFARHEKHRRAWLSEGQPILSRLKTHLERRNSALFSKDIGEFDRMCDAAATDLHRLRLIGELERIPGNLLSLPRPGWFDRIQQRVAYSWAKDRRLFSGFVAESRASGRSLQLWHELAALSGRLAACYWYISPLLQPAVYWRNNTAELSDYVVCEKRFVELKHLYVEAFETVCRLSAIAIALESIIFHGTLEIPAKKGSIPIRQYDTLPNAQKHTHLAKYPISDMFVGYMDTGLRNGIGHNTARYDPACDEVVWTIRRTGSDVEDRMGYTSFCLSVLDLLSTLVHVQEYFFAVHVRADVMPC